LEDIYKRNLFLITAVGEEHGLEYSYRYHTLFAEFLQHQLSHRYPQRKVQLHRLAAEFLQAPTQRVHHYMAAEVWDEAAGLIEMVGRNQLEQNYVSNELFQWISELPDPLIERRPWLVLLQGVFKKQTGYMQAADGLLNRAFTVFAAANDTEGQLYALIHINGLEGVPIPPEKTKQAEQMLDAHPDLVSPIIQAHFHLSITWRSLYQNDWISAEEHLYNAVYITEKSNDFGAYQLMSLSIGPQFLFADRGIPPIKAFFQHVLNRFGEGDSPLHMGAYANYGCIHFFQGKLDLARQAAAHAQDINRSLGSFAYMDMPINQVLLYDMLARADYKTLDAYLESLLPQLMESDTAQAMLPGFLYVQGRSFLLQDKLDDCRAVHERISDVFQYYTEQKVDERALILGGLIAAQAGDFSEAEALLQDAIEIQRFTRHTVLSSDARLSLAQLYITWDKPERASNLLQITLKDLEQRGMPGVLLQEGNAAKPLLRYAVKQHIQEAFAARVLKIFDKSSKPSSLQIEHHDHGDFEPLSDREIEVVRLLADGMTNPQIASRLFISTGTVKRHTVNIYRKLRVHNRTQAVNRARSLNLI
jgi:LuxR family maltose regulon positive regulatory protein